MELAVSGKNVIICSPPGLNLSALKLNLYYACCNMIILRQSVERVLHFRIIAFVLVYTDSSQRNVATIVYDTCV